MAHGLKTPVANDEDSDESNMSVSDFHEERAEDSTGDEESVVDSELVSHRSTSNSEDSMSDYDDDLNPDDQESDRLSEDASQIREYLMNTDFKGSDTICLKKQEWKNVSASDSDASTSDDEVNTTVQSSNPGWAKAMAKILSTNKPSGKKSIILSKAEKISQVIASQKAKDGKQDPGFDIVGETKEEKPDLKNLADDVKPKLDLVENKVSPSIFDREKERRLMKIATKGVVQLFNAVRRQQKEIKRKVSAADGRIRKEDKVIKSLDKRAFVDMLMGNTPSSSVTSANLIIKKKFNKELKSEQANDWSVLRENFLTDGNLKNWDKSEDMETEQVNIS